MAYTLVYTSIDALTTSVTGYTGTPIDVVVPETADGGRTVVSIGDSAFFECASILSISLPDRILSIGDYAFSDSSISSIGDMPSLTTIGVYAFAYSSLSSIGDMPSLVTIGSGAFSECFSLSSIGDMPSLQTIGNDAFYACSLSSIGDMQSLVTIGIGAFYACNALTALYFSGDIPTFGANCFNDGNGFPIPATAYILTSATGWPTPPIGVGDPLIPTSYIEASVTPVDITPIPLTTNADLFPDLGIGTAVYMSLFDAPAWNESFKLLNERIDSIGLLEKAFNEPIIAGTMSKIQRIASSQLKWLLDDGVCSQLMVAVRNPELGLIEIDITATEPNDVQNRYKVMWNREEQKLMSFVRTPTRSSVVI